jgi:integrase/recombinase XerC
MYEAYFRYLTLERRLSTHSLQAYKTDLDQFADYLVNCETHTDPSTVDYPIIRGWIIFLMESGISPRSINRKIASLRSFFRFTIEMDLRKDNPCDMLQSLKTSARLPEFIRATELQNLLEGAYFTEDFEGERDKTIIELFYGCGLRLSELIQLKESAINFSTDSVKVKGKGNKERIIPMHRPLKIQLERYLEAKKTVGYIKANGYLFVTNKSNKMYPMMVWRIIRKYLNHPNAHPHLLRHSYATHLLDAGAEINAIKDLLGHSSLAATQVYTHTSLEKLKDVFRKAHPKA